MVQKSIMLNNKVSIVRYVKKQALPPMRPLLSLLLIDLIIMWGIILLFFSVAQASSETSYIVVHTHNPEGIEIASIEDMGQSSVEIYDGDTLIGYGAYNADTHNKPIAILPGTHTIKAVFNGMTNEEPITLNPNETKVVTFTFERTVFDLESYLQSISDSGGASLNGTLDCVGNGRWVDDYKKLSQNNVRYGVYAGANYGSKPISIAYDIRSNVTITQSIFEAELFARVDITKVCEYQGDYLKIIQASAGAYIQGSNYANWQDFFGENDIIMPINSFSRWFVQGIRKGDYPALVFAIGHLSSWPSCSVWFMDGLNSLLGTVPASSNNLPITNIGWDATKGIRVDTESSKENYILLSGQFSSPRMSSVPYDLTGTGVKDGEDRPPVASFTNSPEKPVTSEEITFDASSSNDPDGTIVKYEWDFGDGSTGEGQMATHAYYIAGAFTVNLIVTDNNGLISSIQKSITVDVVHPVVTFHDKDDPNRQIIGAAADGASKVIVQISNLPADITPDKVRLAIADGDGYFEDAGTINSGTYTITYVAPAYFVRTGIDPAQGRRPIGLSIGVNGQEINHSDFFLVKPPLVMLHGLWDYPNTWLTLASELTTTYGYSWPYLVSWGYDNSASLDQLSGVIDDAITTLLKMFSNNNIVAKKADVVAHSYGGLVAKLYGKESNIRSIVTIGTPHLGSPLADFLCERVACTLSDSDFELFGSPGQRLFAHFMDTVGQPARRGAVKDLREIGGRHCSANDFDPNIPTYAMAGISPLAGPTDEMFNQFIGLIKLGYITKGEIMKAKLSPDALNQVIFEGQENDWLVKVSSQYGGFPVTSNFPVAWHVTEVKDYAVLDSIIGYLHRSAPAQSITSPLRTTEGQDQKIAQNQEIQEALYATSTSGTNLSPGVVQITTPFDGQVFQQNEIVSVHVNISNGTVVYIGSSSGEYALLENAPYDFQFTIPADTIGPMTIIAVAADETGFIGSDEITLNVTNTATLTDIRVYPELNPLYLRVNLTIPLSVYGLYDDTITRRITSSTTGTSYNSSDPTIIEVSAEGIITVKSVGQAVVSIENSGVSKEITVIGEPNLIVNKAGDGTGTVTSSPVGINCGTDCSEIYNYNMTVTLSASADTGSTFIGWSGACTGTGTCEVTMDAAKSITATFTRITYALAVSKIGIGTIASSPAGINCGGICSASFDQGSLVTLTSIPDPNSVFTGWSGACGGGGVCQVTMNAAKSVTANFTAKAVISWNVVNGVRETCVNSASALATALYEAGSDGYPNTIKVVQGTYIGLFAYSGNENFNLNLECGYVPGCSTFSYNPELTILNGDINADNIGDGVVLDLSITNSGGIGNITVEGFHVTNGQNSVDDGGCIRTYTDQGDTIISGNIISNCEAMDAGGIGIQTDSGAIDIINNIIYGNTATNDGGGIGVSTATGTVTILNNTITGNIGGDIGGVTIELGDTAHADLQNNIIWGNAGPIPDVGINTDFDTNAIHGSFWFDYNDTVIANMWTNHPAPATVNGPHNINGTNPLFVDAANGNYHLINTSSVMDTGNSVHALLPAFDIDGQARVRGTAVDIGADEIELPVAPVVTAITPTKDTTPTWTWTTGGGGNGTFRYRLDNPVLTTGATTTTLKSFTPVIGLTNGSHTLYVQEKNAAGLWSATGSKTVLIDTVVPLNGIVTATAGAGQIQLNWSGFTDALSGIATYKIVYAKGTAPISCAAGTVLYNGSSLTYTHTGLINQTYGYRVCAIDNAGNISTGVTKTAKPLAAESNSPTGSVLINGGAAWTKKTAVTLALAAADESGITQYCISNTGTCTTWTTVTATTNLSITKTWTLATGNGAKTVNVWFKDTWDNKTPVGTPSTATIGLDTTAPINGTVTATSEAGQVVLNWPGFTDAFSGIAGYKVVYAIGIAPTSCATGTVLYNGTNLTYTHTGLINKTYGYRVCAIDNAGNISTGVTKTAKPSPTEKNPPTGSVLINSGAAWTKKTTVTLALAATDESGITQYCISNTGTCTTWTTVTATTNLSITKTWTLAAGNGVKTVNVWFKDTWGNATPAGTPNADTIGLDMTAPITGTVTATPGPGQIALSWSGTDALSGVAGYKVVYATGTAPLSCSTGKVVPGYDGVSASYTHNGLSNATTYGYRVCAIDKAGNMSTGATKSAKPL